MFDKEDRPFIAILVAVMLFWGLLVFAMIYMNGQDDAAKKQVVPACLEEDGSTQKECVWDDGTGLIVHNWDYGKHYSTQVR